MRNAIDLAGAVHGNDLNSLRAWLHFNESDGFVHFRRSDQYGEQQWYIKPFEPINKFVRRNNWKRAGTILLHEMINKKLSKNAGVGVVFGPRRSELSLRIKLDNLLAGLWMQLASSVALGRIRDCEVCGQLMVLGPRTRSDKTSCSGACTARLYRQRKKNAEA